jgi:hypothetical protein
MYIELKHAKAKAHTLNQAHATPSCLFMFQFTHFILKLLSFYIWSFILLKNEIYYVFNYDLLYFYSQKMICFIIK